ncbi:MAG: oxygen-independent coproporphyrinogen III oxidase [Bacteroidaceae bacterium]|nr:oxygen-independent coproporphyrinogen III oxidase [Bacteroidaceae bacterium]
MRQNIIDKYNIPVPRYTSYPPANYFGTLGQTEYIEAVKLSNTDENRNLSFYFHMPFCRHLCHYCACNSYAMGNSAKVNEYIDALHKEIDLLLPHIDKDRRISQIHYGGGTPTAMPAQILKELNQHLLSHFGTIDKPEIAIECHPGYLTLNDWSSLVDAGFTRFSIGVQDFDEKVLKAVNRRPTLEPIEEIFALLHETEANINLDFLYGLPYQTVESFSSTIERAIALQPDRLVTFSYAHVPWLKKQQLILEKYGLPSVQTKETMFETSAQLLQKAGYVRVGMDHFVRPHDELYTALCQHRLHRNFQGYCTLRTTAQVYAFGVTGISQLSTAYAQNTKDIDEYISSVNDGILPIRKGYTLTAEQQLIRTAIDDLMCNYAVTLTPEQKAAVNFDTERLAEMQNDGIININENTIKMTEASSPLVRNVAALLDPLMQNTSKTFSKPI